MAQGTALVQRKIGWAGLALVAAILLVSLRQKPLPQAPPAAGPSEDAFAPTIPNTAIPPRPAPEGMVWIPGGEFSMGATASSEGLCELHGVTQDSLPVHRVYVDGFWMDSTEVTNAPTTLIYTHSAGTPTNFWKVQDEFSPPTGTTSISLDGSSMVTNSTVQVFASFATALSDDLVYGVAHASGTATHGAGTSAGQGDGTQRMSEWAIKAAPGTVSMNVTTAGGNWWGPAFGINGVQGTAGLTFAGGASLIMM